MTSRPYAGADDLQQIVGLLCRVRPAERIADYPGPTDLHELLSLPAVQANTRLWLDKGQIVAFALVDSYNNLVFEHREATPTFRQRWLTGGWSVSSASRTRQKNR